MALEEFAFRPISEKADKSHFAKMPIHNTEVVRNGFVEDEKIVFPLKDRYDAA